MGILEYEDLTYKIRGSIFEIYNILGPGFKESVYHNSLREEFDKKKIKYSEKKKIKISYKGKDVGIYEPDFMIEDKIIIEIKAVDLMPKVFEKQLYSYLKATKYKIGILVNFGADKLDIRRRIYG
jgi:GxxExxY protein